MQEMSVREANQNFSKVIAMAESGETVIITKNGKPVAKIAPAPADRTQDPEWQAAHARLLKHFEELRRRPDTGFRIGEITEDDLYG